MKRVVIVTVMVAYMMVGVVQVGAQAPPPLCSQLTLDGGGLSADSSNLHIDVQLGVPNIDVFTVTVTSTDGYELSELTLTWFNPNATKPTDVIPLSGTEASEVRPGAFVSAMVEGCYVQDPVTTSTSIPLPLLCPEPGTVIDGPDGPYCQMPPNTITPPSQSPAVTPVAAQPAFTG